MPDAMWPCWLCYTPGYEYLNEDRMADGSEIHKAAITAFGQVMHSETDCDLPMVLYPIIAGYIMNPSPTCRVVLRNADGSPGEAVILR